MRKHLLVANAVLLALSSAAHADWAFTDLGAMTGGASMAVGINNAGTVIGYSSSSTFSAAMQPFNGFTYRNGTLTQLGSYNGSSTYLSGINDLGVISGTSYANQAFTYSNGGFSSLPQLGNWTAATGINNLGQTILMSGPILAGGTNTSYVYSNGITTNIGSLGGGDTSARAINNLGQVTGSTHDAAHSVQAFLYSGGTMTGIGKQAGYLSTIPYDINNAGLILGNSYREVGSNGIHSVSLYSNGQWTNILPGATNAFGYALNDLGAVVGESNGRGYLYSGGTYLDLMSIPQIAAAGFTSVRPWDINNLGQIVGEGAIRVGNSFVNHAFLLMETLTGGGSTGGGIGGSGGSGGGIGSVPEPQTYGLMMAGLALLAWLQRRGQLRPIRAALG